jgi:hypothetical protein
MNERKHLCVSWNLCLVAVVSIAMVLFSVSVAYAFESSGTEHYKMLSSVEYSGKTQYKNQVETLLTVRKDFLSDDQVQYFISSRDFDLVKGNLSFGQDVPARELSFIVNKRTKRLSTEERELALLERINNHCVLSLGKHTKDNIGRTWKQSFNLSSLDSSLPDKISFTLTAMPLSTEVFGELIAVRALSEPFTFQAPKVQGGLGDIKSRINTVYLFDPEIETVYMSISVFEATANINGFKEKLRHEVATYKSNASGESVDLSGLGKEFGKFVRKVGLNKKSIDVTKRGHLPQWARSEAVTVAEAGFTCGSIACEGAPNPVATVFVPIARTVAMQSSGALLSIGTIGTVSGALAANVVGISTVKIAAVPAIAAGMGMNAGTAAAVAGGATAIAVTGSEATARSPSTP